MRAINQFLYWLIQNVNYLFLFSFFIARDRDHAFIVAITFVIAQFLEGMLFEVIVSEKISCLDLENLHRFHLLASFLLLYPQYLQLLISFRKAYSKEC